MADKEKRNKPTAWEMFVNIMKLNNESRQFVLAFIKWLLKRMNKK